MRNIILPAILIVSVLSACNGVVDLNQFKSRDDLIEIVDMPDNLNILVGEDYRLVAKLRIEGAPLDNIKQSIQGHPDDYNIVDVVVENDTTVILRGISEGETDFHLQYSPLEKVIHVTVKDLDLNNVIFEKTDFNVNCGEVFYAYFKIDPPEYPLGNIRVERDKDDLSAPTASVMLDKKTSKPCVMIHATQVGDFSVNVIGKERGKDKIKRTLNVKSGAVPVESVFFRQATDMIITPLDEPLFPWATEGWDMDTTYVYKTLSSPFHVSLKEGKDEFVNAVWSPENATITNVFYEITYTAGSINLKWTSDTSSGDAGELDLAELQRLIEAGILKEKEDIEKYIQEHSGISMEPLEEEKTSGVYRVTKEATDVYSWRIEPNRAASVTIKFTVEYVNSYDESGIQTKTKTNIMKVNIN